MAEVIGLISGLYTIGKAGLTLYDALSTFAGGIKTAERDIKIVASEIKSTSEVLLLIRDSLEDSKDSTSKNVVQGRYILEGLSTQCEFCHGLIRELVSFLTPYYDTSKTAKSQSLVLFGQPKTSIKLLDKWRWQQRLPKIDKLRGYLEAIKSNLALLLPILRYEVAEEKNEPTLTLNRLKESIQEALDEARTIPKELSKELTREAGSSSNTATAVVLWNKSRHTPQFATQRLAAQIVRPDKTDQDPDPDLDCTLPEQPSQQNNEPRAQYASRQLPTRERRKENWDDFYGQHSDSGQDYPKAARLIDLREDPRSRSFIARAATKLKLATSSSRPPQRRPYSSFRSDESQSESKAVPLSPAIAPKDLDETDELFPAQDAQDPLPRNPRTESPQWGPRNVPHISKSSFEESPRSRSNGAPQAYEPSSYTSSWVKDGSRESEKNCPRSRRLSGTSPHALIYMDPRRYVMSNDWLSDPEKRLYVDALYRDSWFSPAEVSIFRSELLREAQLKLNSIETEEARFQQYRIFSRRQEKKIHQALLRSTRLPAPALAICESLLFWADKGAGSKADSRYGLLDKFSQAKDNCIIEGEILNEYFDRYVLL